jgi:uncharacterized protein YabN with tetrapyrrole methylase and pyrophosphatase domain
VAERRQGSLVVIGTGYHIAGQTTPEAFHYLRKSETVFYLVYDGLTEHWIRSIRPSAISLRKYFRSGRNCVDCCNTAADHIIAAVRRRLKVCAAFSGHPSICLHPSHESLRRARLEGFSTKVLPAVSALDCMFADLEIDPLECGYQIADASAFLVYGHKPITSSALVLLQIANLGKKFAGPPLKDLYEKVKVLKRVLQKSYPSQHDVILYETAANPLVQPRIQRVKLSALDKQDISFSTTLYVPPVGAIAGNP